MDFALFTNPGLYYVFKWLHFFFGVMWIGYLYYFNFTQGTFMAGADAATKSQVTQKLVPVALYWFRWGAMWTFVTGLLMLATAHWVGYVIHGDWGVKILTGALFGTMMWANVWFVIWPKQKVIIKSAQQVAAGGTAIPEAALYASQALLASRTNTFLSIPMLFFMGAASSLPVTMDMSKVGIYFIALLIVAAIVEFNALKGKLGPLTTVKGVITSGFIFTAFLYLMMEVIL